MPKHTPIYEDSHLLAINKPRGLLTVANKSNKQNLLDQLKPAYTEQNTRLRPINRLDQGTSGIVFFAKTKECFEQAVGKHLFSSPETKKTYLAVIIGIPNPPSGSITRPLPSRRDSRHTLKAETRYKTLKTYNIKGKKIALVEAQISSGRFHQIRRHFTKIRNPLLMDRDYMDRQDYKHWQGLVSFRHYFLHAHTITFKHFVTGEQLTIEAPIPDLPPELK